MEVLPLKSEKIQSGSALLPAIVQAFRQKKLEPESRDILVIASKVLAYSQGLLKKVGSEDSFQKLIKSEADQMLEEGSMVLTLKNNILIPNAGIDRSNVPEGYAVLWPHDPFGSAEKIRRELMEEFNLNQMGIIISDSHCQPLRRGTSGLAIGWAGFEGVVDERGSADLYGKKMAHTQVAVADSLAAAANLVMGETDASTPFALIRGFEGRFTDELYSEKDYFMPVSECIFRPLYPSNFSS